MLRYVFAIASIIGTAPLYAASFYCPQKMGYINTGMSQDQVLNACGEPNSRQTGNNVVAKQVPVKVLIYSSLNQQPVSYEPALGTLYQMWNLPTNAQNIDLQVNVIDNRVASITLNNSSTNAMSACPGGVFQIGDDVNKVFAACGSPYLINNTYINQTISKDQKPELWTYTFPYQPSVTLTFVNGQLQSIN